MCNVVKYDRLKGVPNDHYLLMKIDCFGEMGGPYYSDDIIYHSKSKFALEQLCKKEGFDLVEPKGWNEYFITTPAGESK